MKKLLIIFSIFIFSLNAQEPYELFKEKTVTEMLSFPGWCSKEKAQFIMDFVQQHKPKVCVELGVFAGRSLFPVAKALEYTGSGQLFGIDAWSSKESVRGFDTSDPNYAWWNTLDYDSLYNQTLKIVQGNNLDSFCKIIRTTAQDAVATFADGSIDFIHIDANHNEECVLEDVMAYFPKVKDGGYILLNDPCWYSMRYTLIYLLERADLLSEFSRTAPYFLLKKNEKKMQNAQVLFRS